MRDVYISNIDVDKAKEDYFKNIKPLSPASEQINVLDSLNRITYESVYSKISSPHFNAAAMDGIAVRAEDTYGTNETSPKILTEGKDFEYLNTGYPIKHPYNAVIMIEDVMDTGDGKVKIISSAYPWQYVRQIGEDIVAGEMIVPSRHKIRPVDVGALLTGGIEKINVYRQPRVGILPTGSELVEKSQDLKEGSILETNSRVIEGLVLEYGGIPNRYSSCTDDYEALKSIVKKGVEENDIFIVNAGSSAGTKDFTAEIIRELGEVVVHGVAMKPGKPTILGFIADKPILGIPGYPVSSYLVFETFVKPLIFMYSGNPEVKEQFISAVVTKRMVSSLKNKELVRVTLGHVGSKFVATPLSRNASVTMSLVKADGILSIPKNFEGIEAGEKVDVKLLKDPETIKETLVSIGSHDMIMDEISDLMKLSSGHAGSMGGIMAMKRGECHIAPIHLLDEDTGEYNLTYVKRFFSDRKMALIKGVKRLQGLIVRKGNPLSINSFSDLSRSGLLYINRQTGAGTRLLLDLNLRRLGIDAKNIQGYEREMTTHMAVAACIKTGTADVGLGIMSAARSMDLDFVPVAYEDYDFLTSYEYLEDDKIKKFIEILKSHKFKDRVTQMEGYEFSNTGDIIVIG